MTLPARDCEVLVAGAGIAGLAMIRALRRSGISAIGLEARLRDDSSGLDINLPGNAIAALRRLGVGDELGEVGRPVRRREYRSHRGRLLFAMDETVFWGEASQPRCMRRSAPLALLGDGLPPDLIQRGCRVVGVDDDHGFVRARLDDDSVATGSMLVGADGVYSTVRNLAMGKAAPRAARPASASWRFMAPNPGVDGWTLWTGDVAMLLLIPVDDRAVYGWAAMTWDREVGDPNELRKVFARFPEPVRAAIDYAVGDSGQLYHSPLTEVRLSSWGRGRTILIGDAAHATAPVWAQGAALAMEDGAALSARLATHPDWDEVRLDFEACRRGRVAHVQKATDRMSKAAALPPALRALLMPWLGPRSYRAAYEPLKVVA